MCVSVCVRPFVRGKIIIIIIRSPYTHHDIYIHMLYRYIREKRAHVYYNFFINGVVIVAGYYNIIYLYYIGIAYAVLTTIIRDDPFINCPTHTTDKSL